MRNLPIQLYDQQALKALDRNTIEIYGIAGDVLMKRAAAAALAQLRECWPQAQRITVICGIGNNAGDGLVLARLACEEGLQVEVLTVQENPSFHDEAQAALDMAIHRGVPLKVLAEKQDLTSADIIVDAIFGIGLDREVSGIWAQAITQINESNIPVFSIDIPSGLCPNTGCVFGIAVKADTTITFIGLKQGLFTNDGPEKCGKLYFDSLDVPEEVYDTVVPTARRITFADIVPFLLPRQRNAHKGNFGHVLVIAGDQGFGGAARMAAEAAARVGAGLVSIATHPEHAAVIAALCPEIMSHAINTKEDLEPLLERATVLAIGPGLRNSVWGKNLWGIIAAQKKPKIVDAGALSYLAEQPYLNNQWILTPHPGEAAHLLNTTTLEIQNDRFLCAKKLQEKYGGVIVLKGCGTIILGSNKFSWVCNMGNPGMATGGMGDLLTGIIAGFVAQGLSLEHAAITGVFVHATAADYAAEYGERGMLATDLIPFLREIINP